MGPCRSAQTSIRVCVCVCVCVCVYVCVIVHAFVPVHVSMNEQMCACMCTYGQVAMAKRNVMVLDVGLKGDNMRLQMVAGERFAIIDAVCALAAAEGALLQPPSGQP